MRIVAFSIVVSLFLTTGCGDDIFGSGIGRRPADIGDINRPTLAPLKITEVFVAASVAADQLAAAAA
ncbi:MAG: hypothetical protein V3T05_02545, partial [Myxococcota bacterium]